MWKRKTKNIMPSPWNGGPRWSSPVAHRVRHILIKSPHMHGFGSIFKCALQLAKHDHCLCSVAKLRFAPSLSFIWIFKIQIPKLLESAPIQVIVWRRQCQSLFTFFCTFKIIKKFLQKVTVGLDGNLAFVSWISWFLYSFRWRFS